MFEDDTAIHGEAKSFKCMSFLPAHMVLDFFYLRPWRNVGITGLPRGMSLTSIAANENAKAKE